MKRIFALAALIVVAAFAAGATAGYASASVAPCHFDCPVPTPAPPAVVTVDTPQVFLCYSSFLGSVPGVVDSSDIALRLVQGWFAPIAVSKAEAAKQNIPTYKWTVIAGYVLVCNPDGLKGTGAGLNGSEGDFFNAAAWTLTLARYGSQHPNHYEIYS